MTGANAGPKALRITRRWQRRAGKAFVALVLFAAIFISLTPLIWVMLSSFKTNAEVFSGVFWPASYTFDAYAYALETAPILHFSWNSVLVSTAAMLINTAAVTMGAYTFARIPFRGREMLYTLFMTAMVLPATAILQPVYVQVRNLGLLDTRMGLILVYSCFGMPVGLMLMRAFFESVPSEIEESAQIDGAGFVRTFARICVPIVMPGVTTVMVLRFLENWNEFTYALILTTSRGNRTLPLSLAYFVSSFSFNYPAMFAAITLSVLPALILFAIFNKKIVNSMVAGAVKG